eukprot:1196368-Prorocentrum_minimum.AAC.6
MSGSYGGRYACTQKEVFPTVWRGPELKVRDTQAVPAELIIRYIIWKRHTAKCCHMVINSNGPVDTLCRLSSQGGSAALSPTRLCRTMR